MKEKKRVTKFLKKEAKQKNKHQEPPNNKGKKTNKPRIKNRKDDLTVEEQPDKAIKFDLPETENESSTQKVTKNIAKK
jgi:hypothetical protein